jgi:hypothetical protein
LLFGAAIAQAAPFAVQLGDTRIGLDTPPGFADTTFTGSPRLQELAESLTSASNRILMFAITDDDLRKFMVGDPPEFRRYMIAITPKGMERDRVNPQSFSLFVGDSLRELGDSAPPATSYTEYLDTQPPGKASLLAELRREPQLVSVLQGTRLVAQGRSRQKPQYVLSTTTLMLLRGKALNFSVYAAYDSAPDLDWIRSITLRWIEELQRLNSR